MKISHVLQKSAQTLKKAGVLRSMLEAEILLRQAIVETRPQLNPSREWLLANPNYLLNTHTLRRLDILLQRRLKGEPIAYIIGQKEFFGRSFVVNRHVLIPRPETEMLVERAMSQIKYRLSKIKCPKCHVSNSPCYAFRTLEIGTGSGCIIISIIKELEKQYIRDQSRSLPRQHWQFVATDISPEALKVAQRNARTHHVDYYIDFIQADLFSSAMLNIQSMKFDLIIANLPYLVSDWIDNRPPSSSLKYEPQLALDGGQDGLSIFRKFFPAVPHYLSPNGTILIEIDDNQQKAIRRLSYQFLPNHQITCYQDLSGKNRVIEIQLRNQPGKKLESLAE